MSTTYIGAALRRAVIARAESVCEYCLIHEDDTFCGCHVDHVISEKSLPTEQAVRETPRWGQEVLEVRSDLRALACPSAWASPS